MKKGILRHLIIMVVILVLSLTGSRAVQAEKREVYKDDATASMRDAYVRREKESKEYRNKMLSNSDEAIKLLREIKDLLSKQNQNK